MAIWRDLGKNNRTAANQLFESKQWRSSISRAYYAVYSSVTDALLSVPIAMPAGKEGPHHLPLPVMIGNNLTLLNAGDRWKLSGVVNELYGMRCIADYRPSITVEDDEARIALGLLNQACRLLERIK